MLINIFLVAAIYNLEMGKPADTSYRIKIADALSDASSLSSVWRACHSASFIMRLEEIYTAYEAETPGPVREEFDRSHPSLTDAEREEDFTSVLSEHRARLYSAALAALIEKNPAELKHLTNADLGKLADLTSLPSGTRADTSQIESLHARYKISNDAAFLEWDSRRKLSLSLALGDDPDIGRLINKDAQLNKISGGVAGLSLKEKSELAGRITDIQSRVYGYPRPIIDVKDLSARGAWGEFDGSEGAGTITFDENLMKENRLGEFIKTVLHENDHAFQSTLSKRLQPIQAEEWKWETQTSKKINIADPSMMTEYQNHMSLWMVENLPGGAGDKINAGLMLGGKLRQAAYSMVGNDRQYIDHTKSETGYRSNPMEQHSVRAEQVGDHLLGDPKERLELMKNWVADIKNGLAEDRDYKRGLETLKPAAFCPAP